MGHVVRRAGRSRPYYARWVGPDGKESSKSFARKVDAESYLTGIEASKLRGDYVDPALGKVSFGEFAAAALALKVNQRPTTKARDEWAFRLMILPYFAKRPLGSIGVTEAKGWIAKLAGDYRPASVHKAYQLFAWVMQEAAEAGSISRSPCWRIRPKRDLPRIEQFEMRFLDEAEIRAVADAIDPFYRPLVLTAGYTGMRFGELAGLRIKHLRQLERTILVEEAMTDVRGHQSFGPVKTRASRRSISIPQFLVELLAEHLAERSPVFPERLVFPGERGGPLRASNFRRRAWDPAVRDSVGPPCRFHDLRHSHAALLIKAGVHPKVIQKRLGHSSIRTTLDTYGHVYDGLDAEVALQLDRSWQKDQPQANTRTVSRESMKSVEPSGARRSRLL